MGAIWTIFLCWIKIIIFLDKFEVLTLESFDNNHSNIGEVKSYIKRLVVKHILVKFSGLERERERGERMATKPHLGLLSSLSSPG